LVKKLDRLLLQAQSHADIPAQAGEIYRSAELLVMVFQVFRKIHASFLRSLGLAYWEEDFENGFKYLSRSAEMGDNRAQIELGTRYSEGDKVELDDDKAFFWYQKVVENGYPYGEANLGWVYFEGRGVEQDYSESRRWFEKSAKKGHDESQYALGVIYAEGLGTDQNLPKAKVWLEKAASQSLIKAKEFLERVSEKP